MSRGARPKRARGGEPVRLQKRLARLGVGSRRECERLVEAGRVAVNGEVVTRLGTTVAPGDRLAVDGREVATRPQTRAIVLNKPVGVVCARHDPQGRQTVYDLLPADLPFLAHVGRLDIQSEGVLLMTNDGDLARDLLDPDANVPRTYHVKVRGRLGKDAIRRIEEGVPLDGRPTRPAVLERLPSQSKHDWLRLTLFEGRKRHVRRVFETLGHPVTKLRRVSFGELTADDLPPGGWRPLSRAELRHLRGFLDT